MTIVNKRRRRQSVLENKSEMEIFTDHFKATLVYDRAADGKYAGLITGARVKNHNKIPKLFVDVEFKDNFNNLIKKTWMTDFRGDNFRVILLFDSFEVEYENVRVIDLNSLIKRKAEITIKNNREYCNITSIIPFENRVSEEDIEASLEIDDDDLDEEFDEDFDMSEEYFVSYDEPDLY